NNDMTVHLSVNQKTSLSSIPLFDLPVEIELKGENNYDTLIIIQPSLSFQEYYFNTEKKVTQIIFDPHHWLICNSNIFEKLQQDPDIKIYPNPARKYLSIEYRSNNFSQTIYQIEILDMAGKVIYKDLSTYSPWNKISIPLTLLSKGIYFLRININNSSDKNKAVYKFFVEDQSK
ncbi:MAG: T9SS type A sorting domain-containing protein, partial [Bacteroidota bacterium]|nr:T9SS type A sorting domain-containing protein [Bacteroidota bacterium]